MRIQPRRPFPNQQRSLPDLPSLLDVPSVETPSFSLHGATNPLAALDAWRANDDQQQHKAVRWHPQAMPLRLSFELETGGFSRDALRHVLGAWEKASMGNVQFIFANSTDADIRLEWTDEATLGREFEVGHTQRQVQGRGWITQATIILLRQPIIDGYLDAGQQQKRLQATLLHEIGHALGLEHSQHSSDVMYYRGWQNSQITLRDAEQLQGIYKTNREFRWA